MAEERLISDLPSAAAANSNHIIAAILDGQTEVVTIGQISMLVVATVADSAPATLDTLNELAAALGDDPNFATTVANALAAKADASTTNINGLTAKTTPVDADVFRIADSAASFGFKKLTFANLWAWIKAKIVGEVSLLRLQTAATLTSGTQYVNTDIPSWAKRVSIHFIGISTTGTSVPGIQLGTASGFEATGYIGSVTNTVTPALFSASFALSSAWNAATIIEGSVELQLIDAATNTWSIGGVVGFSNSAGVVVLSGRKALAGTLDRVRVFTADAFDGTGTGKISVSWE